MQDETIFLFGPFALERGQRVLRREGKPLRLTPKEIDVLIVLVERHAEIVDKGLLFDHVWRGVCVEDCNLSQHVAALRRILGDVAKKPIYIETVPRRGYRFTAPVTVTTRSSVVAFTAAASPPWAAPPPDASTPTPTPLAFAPDATTPTPTPLGSATGSPPQGEVTPATAPPRTSKARWGRLGHGVSAALLVLAAVGVGLAVNGSEGCSPVPRVQSIAVLPLANMTGDSHQDPFAATLTSSLTSALRGVSGLRVSTAGPEAANHPHRAEGVDALLEVALLRGEGRVRLSAELIDARTGRLIWAQLLDSDPVSSLEAARQVARFLVAHLDAAADVDDDRVAAHREYALGREYLRRRTPSAVPEALEHLTAAARLDPANAFAHVGVADAYLLGAKQRVLAPSESLAAAEAAARRALELDPGLADAHAALGEIAAARWDFEAAEALYRLALERDPAIASVHERYSALLTVEDRHDDAIAEARVARDLDPGCPSAGTALATAYYHAGQGDAAIQQALAVLRLTPRFAAAYDVIGWSHLAEGRHAEAVAAFGEAVRLSDRSPPYVAALARAYARAGAPEKARRLLSELERSARHRATSPLDLAEVLAAIGETTRALEEIERAIAERAPLLEHVDSGLGLAALHDRARFRTLVGRVKSARLSGAEETVPVAPAGAGTIGASSPGDATTMAGSAR